MLHNAHFGALFSTKIFRLIPQSIYSPLLDKSIYLILNFKINPIPNIFRNSGILISLVLLICSSIQAQVSEYSGYATQIAEMFGMEAISFNDIDEDWNGFIWIATDDGSSAY